MFVYHIFMTFPLWLAVGPQSLKVNMVATDPLSLVALFIHSMNLIITCYMYY